MNWIFWSTISSCPSLQNSSYKNRIQSINFFSTFPECSQIDLYEFLTEAELQHYYNAIK